MTSHCKLEKRSTLSPESSSPSIVKAARCPPRPSRAHSSVVRLQAAELVNGDSGVGGPIDVMRRSCAGICEAKGDGVMGQWMSRAEVAQSTRD